MEYLYNFDVFLACSRACSFKSIQNKEHIKVHIAKGQ